MKGGMGMLTLLPALMGGRLHGRPYTLGDHLLWGWRRLTGRMCRMVLQLGPVLQLPLL